MRQEFIFEGIPTAQGRPRFARKGKRTFAIDPAESRAQKQNVAAQIVAQKHHMAPKGVPVALRLYITMPRPQSHYNTKGELKVQYDVAILPHISRPDLDNLEKLIKDACKGILWYDDSQVWNVHKMKYYGKPGWRMVVEWESGQW